MGAGGDDCGRRDECLPQAEHGQGEEEEDGGKPGQEEEEENDQFKLFSYKLHILQILWMVSRSWTLKWTEMF